MNKRPSIKSIAARTGFSPMTVSRALSMPESVAVKTREQVLKVAEELGYVPGRPPPQLIAQSNNLIGVVLPTIEYSLFAPLVNGVREVADEHRFETLIGITDFDENTQDNVIRGMLSRRPDGLIVIGGTSKRSAKLLNRQTEWVRVVQTWEELADPIDMLVAFDNKAAGALAAEHFLDRGRRRLAYAGPIGGRDGERWQGFRDSALARGAGEPALILLSDEAESETGWLASGPKVLDSIGALLDSPDSLFCGIDEIAHGVLFEAIRRGINVPDDLALCGCGDRPFAAFVEPPLTTVHIPSHEMGRRSAQMLVSRVKGDASMEDITLEPELRVRRSS